MRSHSYQRLNLRFNPFGELTREQRVELALVNLHGLADFLREPRRILQFIADHGRGKTTHLLCLHQQLNELGDWPYAQLYPGESEQLSHSKSHCIDSIENLSFWRRWQVYRRYRSLAVTTHRDLSREMRWAGLQVKTVMVGLASRDSTQLARIFNRRVEFARLSENLELPLVSELRVTQLQQQFGDDIRAMEHQLYEEYYQLREAQHG